MLESASSFQYHRIVVKLGTSTLTGGSKCLSLPRMVDLARQMALLSSQGLEVALVSSGAIAAGRERLDYPQLPKDIPAKQMLAAVGQPRLMAIWEQLFGLYGLAVGQVLFTRGDLADRRRYINSRNTLTALLGQRVMPIINENDTVATEEIRLGDNDNLSALAANLVEADLLAILTDQPGLFTADPRSDPTAELVREVSGAQIPPALWTAAGGAGSGLGVGGMTTKLQAAELARRAGAHVAIAAGDEADVLLRLARGERLGTHFFPTASALEGRKRYLLAGRRAPGQLQIDEGAAQALRRGGSLLPVGVKTVEGRFERGDTVQISGPDGRELARGLVNYAAGDLRRIMGRRSESIEPTLGYFFGDEVVHHNNMVLL